MKVVKWKDGIPSTNLDGKLGGNKTDQDDEMNKSNKFRGGDFGAERNWFKRQRKGAELGVFSSAGIIFMFYALLSYIFWLLGGGSLINGLTVAVWMHM